MVEFSYVCVCVNVKFKTGIRNIFESNFQLVFFFFFLQVTIVKTVLTGYVVIWAGSMTCRTPFFETMFVFVCVRVYCFRVNQMV